MKRYASIRFDRAIGPVNAAGAFVDAIVAGDAYLITREGDDVTVTEVASGIVLEVPWSRVISGSPMPMNVEGLPAAPYFRAALSHVGVLSETLREHNSDVEPAQIDEEKIATLAPRKGGWPKGKPRKCAAEGGEA
jgi:hypothetical protein